MFLLFCFLLNCRSNTAMYVFEEWKTVDGDRKKVDLPDKKGCAKYDYLKGHTAWLKSTCSSR